MKRAKRMPRRAVKMMKLRARVWRAAQIFAGCLGSTAAEVLRLAGVEVQ